MASSICGHATWPLHRLHLCASRERLLLLGQFLNDFRELDNFFCLLCLFWKPCLLTQECFSRSTQLREPIIDHLFVAVNIGDPDFLILVDALLRDPLVKVLLLGAQVTKIDVDLGEGRALLVHLLVGCFALAEDSEGSVVPVARQRRHVGAARLAIDRAVVH